MCPTLNIELFNLHTSNRCGIGNYIVIGGGNCSVPKELANFSVASKATCK